MRHQITNRVVVAVTVLLVAAVAAFAVVSLQDPGAADRVADVLAIEEPDPVAGEALYVEGAQPPCAACHTLAAAGAESERASNLDELRPSRRETVVSIVGGHIGAHEAQDYRIELSDRQLADLATYIAEVAG